MEDGDAAVAEDEVLRGDKEGDCWELNGGMECVASRVGDNCDRGDWSVWLCRVAEEVGFSKL